MVRFFGSELTKHTLDKIKGRKKINTKRIVKSKINRKTKINSISNDLTHHNQSNALIDRKQIETFQKHTESQTQRFSDIVEVKTNHSIKRMNGNSLKIWFK